MRQDQVAVQDTPPATERPVAACRLLKFDDQKVHHRLTLVSTQRTMVTDQCPAPAVPQVISSHILDRLLSFQPLHCVGNLLGCYVRQKIGCNAAQMRNRHQRALHACTELHTCGASVG
jgi:hypothetical protein